MNNYLRKWEVNINGEPFVQSNQGANFRVVFDIHVSPQNTQSFADIRIYNLSKESNIPQNASIQFIAGFENNADTIFVGSITNVFREREGADIATRLLCRSGMPAEDRGSINSSYGPGTSVVDVLTDLARAWPRFLEIEPEQFSDAPVFTSGYVAQGDIPQILNSLATQFKFEWIQDRGALVISKIGAVRQTTMFDINQFTGMVGIPEVSRGPNGLGVYVTTRINPYIRATSRINVQSEFATYNTGNMFIQELSGDASANGEFNVLTMHYEGDSHGDAWNLNIDALRQGTMPQPLTEQSGTLVWGANVSQEFRIKVKQIADRQRLNPNWYMAVMAFETGDTFNPAEKNRAGSTGTGLLQFLEKTARSLGTTTRQLSMMTAVEQLDYVEKYFAQYQGRIRSLDDMYMAVLWPIAIGKANDYVMWTKTGQYSKEYAQNSGLDKNGDGQITKKEAAERVFRSLERGKTRMR